EKREELLAGVSREPIVRMSDDVRMHMLGEMKSRCHSLRTGARRLVIRGCGHARRDGEPHGYRRRWPRGMRRPREVRCARRRCERAGIHLPLGMHWTEAGVLPARELFENVDETGRDGRCHGMNLRVDVRKPIST